MKSVLLTSLPRYDLVAPPAALGILQGVAKKQGLFSAIFDFNLHLNKNLTHDEWEQLDNWLIFLNSDISDDLKKRSHLSGTTASPPTCQTVVNMS